MGPAPSTEIYVNENRVREAGAAARQQAEEEANLKKQNTFLNSYIQSAKSYKIGEFCVNRNDARRFIRTIKIGVVGPFGSGKSSFIKMITAYAEDNNIAMSKVITNSSGADGTNKLEPWKIKDAEYELFDTRGVHGFLPNQINALKALCLGEMPIGEIINFDRYTSEPDENADPDYNKRLNTILFVFDLNDANLKAYSTNEHLREFGRFLKDHGIEPCCAFMQSSRGEDERSLDEDDNINRLTGNLGITRNRLFLLKNAAVYDKTDGKDRAEVFKLLHELLVCGERFVKQYLEENADQEKPHPIEKWISHMSDRYNIPVERWNTLKTYLQDEHCVTTLQELKRNWREIRDDLVGENSSFSVGIKYVLQKEMDLQPQMNI